MNTTANTKFSLFRQYEKELSNPIAMALKAAEGLTISVFDGRKLPANWQEYINYASCQAIGNVWLNENVTAVLQVPSAIIMEEYNYLINPQHSDFARIKVHAVGKFTFDERLLKQRPV